MVSITKKTLFDYALEYKLAPKDKIRAAKRYLDEHHCGHVKALLQSGALDERGVVELLGRVYRCDVVRSVKDVTIDTAFLDRFDASRLQKLKMLPITFDVMQQSGVKVVGVLVANPANAPQVEDYIREIIPDVGKISLSVAPETEIDSRVASTISLEVAQSGSADFNNTTYDISNTQSADVVSLVNRICLEAVRLNASDIHIQPHEKEVVIRFRLDGMLTEWNRVPRSVQSALINRCKTMANMNINNSMTPQNGRIRLQYGNGIDIRASAMPTIYGEKLVLRLLNSTAQDIGIDKIDLSPQIQEQLVQLIKKTSGIILITGPTGSGKSTTSYACLSLLNRPEVCIVTLEDPVERKIEGMIQCEINQAIDLSFLTLLEETLRQDPDVILIGEIREQAVARIAAQASNTGHLVFSTLHTNTAASAITRLVDMGIEPYMVSSTLNAVLNQRLLRRICEHCKTEIPLSERNDVLPFKEVMRDVRLFKGKGCTRCGGTGYSGRLAVHELLVMDDDVRACLKGGAVSAKTIEAIALKNGMKPIVGDALEKVALGLTTLDEVSRVLC